jgi:hypothetical protein
MQAHPLSHQPLDPVSNDRVSHFLGDGHAEAASLRLLIVPLRNREDMPAMQLRTTRLHREELGALSQPHLLRDA